MSWRCNDNPDISKAKHRELDFNPGVIIFQVMIAGTVGNNVRDLVLKTTPYDGGSHGTMHELFTETYTCSLL